MSYHPPKGVYPPQFVGTKGGRPKGSLNGAAAMRDCLWGYENAYRSLKPPTAAAALWRALARSDFEALERFLVEQGRIEGDPDDYYD